MKSLMKAGARTICLGLAALAALSWSCTKEPSFDGDTGQQAEGAIAQARSFYENTATPLTKSVGEQQIPIKPLPGEMTPLWDKASATVLSDGTTAWVDVPIQTTISYTAVRGGHSHHNPGEECGHDHTPVQAVQKLTVYTAADGTRQSLIATIVPQAGCTAELNGFSSANGLAGFSGFVSWHDLTGKLVRVAGYENGTKTKSVEATEANNAAVLQIVENAILYPITPTTSKAVTKGGYCNLCDGTCEAPNDMSQHCNVCGKYDPTKFGEESKCTCRPRCPLCHTKIPAGKTECPNKCNGFPITPPKFCSVCGLLNCPGHDPNEPSTDPAPPYIVQRDMLAEMLGTWITNQQLIDLVEGSYTIDREDQDRGYEYRHGLYVSGYTDEQQAALDNMRNFFVENIRMFIRFAPESYSFSRLGMALHPIVDTYVLTQERIDMLDYYSYATKENVVYGQHVVPYLYDKKPCTEAVRYIYNAVQNLSSSASDDEINAIFDGWLKMTGGGY